MDYKELAAYEQLREFFKIAYEIDLNVRTEVREMIVDKYIEEYTKNPLAAMKKVKQRITSNFEVDDLDLKIIQKKLDRIIKEVF